MAGTLEVYKGNSYTSLAPVWIKIDENTKDYLRERGGRADIALCVPEDWSNRTEEYVQSLRVGSNPRLVARKYGTLVALLKLRRIE